MTGLSVAWIARRSEGSAREVLCQRLFYGLLTLMGGVTIAALGLGPSYWLASGGTFSAMVLTVTCDFRPSRRATVW